MKVIEMLIPVGTESINEHGNYVLQYKNGCIKYSKSFQNKRKLLSCIKSIRKRKCSYQVFKEVKA